MNIMCFVALETHSCYVAKNKLAINRNVCVQRLRFTLVAKQLEFEGAITLQDKTHRYNLHCEKNEMVLGRAY